MNKTNSKIINLIIENSNWRDILEAKEIKVKENEHFAIFNYNMNADFFDEVVQEARGIIIDLHELSVVAWPFRKFGNYGEAYVDKIDWNTARVLEKLDGCVDENTLILTNYGPKYIGDIVKSNRKYKVLTYNHDLNINEFQDIEGISITDNIDNKQWYEINTEFGQLRLTGNHKVFCANEGIYKRVDELSGDEELLLVEPSDYVLGGRNNRYKQMYNLICNDINNSYLDGTSINEIKHEYHVSWNTIADTLKAFYNIEIRGISSTAKLPKVREKYKNTCREKYGVDNVLQSQEVKEKKAKTFISHYGVDNIRKYKPFYDYIDNVCLKKFGKKRISNWEKGRETIENNKKMNADYYSHKSKVASETAKKTWQAMSKEQKVIKMQKMWDALKKNPIAPNRSKIEKRVYKIVKNHSYNCKHTFWIFKPEIHSYDILFNDIYIIEVNGDYWHANPSIYNANDIIKYPKNRSVYAKDVWEYDENKKIIAENLGFKVIYLWESEINNLSDDDIWQLILNRSYDNEKS